MKLEVLAELQATLVEISASAAVMQAEIAALIATHPDPVQLRGAFLQEIEKQTARALGLAVPDALCERIEVLAGRAAKEMRVRSADGSARPAATALAGA